MAHTPLPTIPNVYRVAHLWRDNTTGQNAVNVTHFQANASGTNATDLSAKLLANWTAGMQQVSASTVAIQQFAITPLDGSTATLTVNTGGGSKFVGGGGSGYSPASAVIVKFQTAHRGPANRGRIFLPFVVESMINNGSVTSGVNVTTVTNAWLAFQTAMETSTPTGYSLGVAAYDRAHGGVGAHFNVAIGISCEGTLGTQRRRQSRLR